MTNIKVLVNAVLAGVAVLSLNAIAETAVAQAKPMIVTRGPNGAAYIVNKVPLGSTPLVTTPSHKFPHLVTRGPGGAAFIIGESAQSAAMKMMIQAHGFPHLITRGPGGAAHIVD